MSKAISSKILDLEEPIRDLESIGEILTSIATSNCLASWQAVIFLGNQLRDRHKQLNTLFDELHDMAQTPEPDEVGDPEPQKT